MHFLKSFIPLQGCTTKLDTTNILVNSAGIEETCSFLCEIEQRLIKNIFCKKNGKSYDFFFDVNVHISQFDGALVCLECEN